MHLLRSTFASNPFKLRRPKSLEIVYQIVILMFVSGMILELWSAYYSFDCRDLHRPRADSCYPWGMTEGPLEGGSWNHLNKDIYLKSHVIFIASLLATIVAPFFMRTPWHTLGVVLLIYLFGLYASESVASLF
ncbi:hypothetical protein [Methylobacterium terrae]|uniref:hypothetical protein n=1 Tax=Methylobacterium terrae TaxID=2202827 RepID=UPI0013A544A0|nr:hypothetical protein [Methylobacterium terrae]